MMRRFAIVALVLFGCAHSSPPPPPLTAPTEMPRSVLEAICNKLHNEGMNAEIDVVQTTAPLVDRESMLALADLAAYNGKKDPAQFADALASNPPMAFDVNVSGCSLHPISRGTKVRNDTMLLQLSAPFLNPFVRNTAGVLARLTLGGENAQWYWIPLAMRNGAWYAGRPSPIALRN